jgi:transposase
MQTRRDNRQQRLILLPPLEEMIPPEHRLRRLQRVLDLSFVHAAVRERYCQDNGRPSIDPEVVMRLFLLQAIEGIGEVRELMRQVEVNLAYRWFIGYELDESLPDHSTLSKALDRFGDEVFDELFSRSIAQCRKSGLIDGKVLHVDATTIRADLDRGKVNQPGSADREARLGRFPDGTIKPGYKQQTVVDDASRVVLGLEVRPANESEHDSAVTVIDEVIERLGRRPEVVCADGAYGSGVNMAALEERGVRLVSPPPQAKTYTGDQYFSVEDFRYDEKQDQFVCPVGASLSYVGGVKGQARKRRYRASRQACQSCPLKARCTVTARRQLKVTVDHAALTRLRADSRTESFRALYRRRAPVIEGVFAEAKQRHGLRRAWRRGLSKMRIQCLLIAAVINFKRLITLLTLKNTPLQTILAALWTFGDLLTIISLWRCQNHFARECHFRTMPLTI